jgi:flagellar motor switch protein FliM
VSGDREGQILTHEEVSALLSAVDRGDIAVAGSGEVPPAPRPIVAYNFRKPSRVSKDQVKMLQSIHESFARLYSSALSTLLGGVVAEVELKSVEQTSYREFVASVAQPTCLAIFNMEPLKGAGAIDISAEILFLAIDRLLTGNRLMPMEAREFKEVEQVLVERVAMRAMVALRQAWQHVGTFGFRVDHMETNPQFAQLTSPNEVMIIVGFDLRVGEVTGKMSLVFPHIMLETVMPKLNRHPYLAMSQRTTSREEGESLQGTLLRLTLGIRGVLAEIPVTVGELLELKPGDILSLGQTTDAPAIIELEGVPRFTGRAGIANRRKALQVLSEISRGEIIREPSIHPGTARVHAS